MIRRLVLTGYPGSRPRQTLGRDRPPVQARRGAKVLLPLQIGAVCADSGAVDFVLCEDDASLRSVVGQILQARGHTVVGEASMAVDGVDLMGRLQPDAVIVDVALWAGSVSEVLRAAEQLGCPAIVFSAYCSGIDVSSFDNRPILVEKPNFEQLESAIDAVAERLRDAGGWSASAPDRRGRIRPGAMGRPLEPIESPPDFYRALASAHPGDSLVAVSYLHDEDTMAVATLLRAIVRAQDHIMVQATRIIVLLVGGSSTAPTSVEGRLRRTLGERWVRYGPFMSSVLIDANESPSAAYARLDLAVLESVHAP